MNIDAIGAGDAENNGYYELGHTFAIDFVILL
jgi:hypothetical protein